jgi:uncharacterized cofD-like protein
LIITGIYGVNRSLLTPFLRPGHPVVDAITQHRRRERGPRVVVVGGGTGLYTLLRGIKNYTHNITAVVAVADDGGSSGQIRRETGILPPGDIRHCLAALSSDEALLTNYFSTAFQMGRDFNRSHSVTCSSLLANITGSFGSAVAESGHVLAISEGVLPSTVHNVRLVADVKLPSWWRVA